jgi:hypothetical protein
MFGIASPILMFNIVHDITISPNIATFGDVDASNYTWLSEVQPYFPFTLPLSFLDPIEFCCYDRLTIHH